MYFCDFRAPLKLHRLPLMEICDWVVLGFSKALVSELLPLALLQNASGICQTKCGCRDRRVIGLLFRTDRRRRVVRPMTRSERVA